MSNASSPAERRALAERLLASAAAMGRASIALSYTDGFWVARFGDRGRRFADEDGMRHAQYLAEAVATDTSGPFVVYAGWLRSVLTARGMCSLHIHDNFVRLGMVIRSIDRDLFAAAAAHLDAGIRALEPTGAALPLHRAAVAGPRIDGDDAFIDDPGFLLSYLADAVSAGQPTHFAAHLRWLVDECGRRGHTAPERLDETLDRVTKMAAPVPESAAMLAEGRRAASRTASA